MWSTTGWANTTVIVSVGTAGTTPISCTCTYWPHCGCSFYPPTPSYEPPLLRIPRHDWWNLYPRDLHDETRAPVTQPAAVRIARRLQPGNLHERRVQKRKRYTQRLRVQ